jgi:hypothetical protein
MRIIIIIIINNETGVVYKYTECMCVCIGDLISYYYYDSVYTFIQQQ